MQFADIHGLDEVKENLIGSVKHNHIAHAQLFLGPQGSANLAMALAYATFLNCENRLDNDACGQCVACIKNKKYVHPDLHFVFPVSSTKKVSGKDVVSASFLTEWRSFLGENVYGNVNDWSNHFGGESKQVNISKEESRNILKNLSLKAFEGKFKIMIIWLPEFMHVSAANGILKILEEPPAQTIFLLVANDAERLLTTILSRTQIFKIRAFTDHELIAVLQSKFGVDSSRAAQLAHVSEGNFNEAIRLLDNVEDDSHKLFRDWMRLCYTWDFKQLNEKTEYFAKMNKTAQKTLFQYGLNIMRESLLVQLDAHDLARVLGEDETFVKNFSKVMDPNKIELIVNHLNTAAYHLERNANTKILFMDLSLQIAGALRG
jgi:DNA polymerase III subunit delta'